MVVVRSYEHGRDFGRIDRFLVESYEPGATLRCWLQPRWEYMFSHPNVDDIDLDSIGVAEDAGRLVGVVHPEHRMAFAHVQRIDRSKDLAVALVDWAERHLGGWSLSLGRSVLGLWIGRHDTVLAEVAQSRGFVCDEGFSEPSSRLALEHGLQAAPAPEGYRLATLFEDNDLSKISRVLWRGFGHPGEPPESDTFGRLRMQRTPGFRRDLTVVAVAPDGMYASYAGVWLVPENQVAYVEPVATDPDHRRRGLGRATVTTALQRAGRAGARVAWVGSDQEFYRSLGFDVSSISDLFVRDLV